MIRKACITVDFGTGSIRTALVEETGKILVIFQKTVEYTKTGSNCEFDPQSIFESILDMLREITKKKPKTLDIIGISVTSQRNGCVFYNSDKRELLGLANIDGRVTRDVLDLISGHSEEIYNETGRWPYINSPALRLLWTKVYQPEVYIKIGYVSMLNDWLAFRLSGNLFSEKTNSTESMLYSLKSDSWSGRLKIVFGIEEVQTPTLVDTGACVGFLKDSYSERTGIGNRVKIYLGPADTQCALIGSGIFKKGETAVVNGSTTPVVMLTDERVFDPKCRTWTNPYLNNKYMLESNCRRTGIVYNKQISDFNSMLKKLGINYVISHEDIEKLLTEENKESSTYVYMGPSICDFTRTEIFKNIICHDFNNNNLFADYFTACIENIAFSACANIYQLMQITGFQLNKVYLTGGGSKNKYFRWIITNLLKEYEVVYSDSWETTSLGAAFMAFSTAFGVGDIAQYVKGFVKNIVINKDINEKTMMISNRYIKWLSIIESIQGKECNL